ncbi:hypothetical protein [uncultured Thiodictyon sp.]|uniref:hypothetical protein n=1 Tax=uncultured Thiodictyon sp. TaxID=1846217 RepID=UPI0025DA2DE6|nr:hypothetical protein [uncultured Thiodictyon sp.]
MARLGPISLFEVSSALPSGAAFSLTSPASSDAALVFPGAEIELRAGQRDAVVRFNGAEDPKAAFSEGHRLAQQGLDLLSVLGRCDAVIQDAESEHLIWWSEPNGVVLRYVSTFMMPFAVGQPTLLVKDKDGNVIPPPPVQPRHHIGFRYYRLAQTTDDLFDAYRNMYLAFEVLLSNSIPIEKGEREINWLNRALTAAQSSIRLNDLVPAQSSNAVKSVLDTVYRDARLPLFHAKVGKAFFSPQESSIERQTVSTALGILTHIVLRMGEAWFSARRMGGGVYFAWVNKNIEQALANCSMIATNHSGPFLAEESNLTHERFQSAIQLTTRLAPELQRESAPAIFGTIAAKDLDSLGEIRRIEVIDANRPYLAQLLESPLVCAEAARLEVLMHSRIMNLNQPRSLFRQ